MGITPSEPLITPMKGVIGPSERAPPSFTYALQGGLYVVLPIPNVVLSHFKPGCWGLLKVPEVGSEPAYRHFDNPSQGVPILVMGTSKRSRWHLLNWSMALYELPSR